MTDKAIGPGWSYGSAGIRVVENNHAFFELKADGVSLASCSHPGPLLRMLFRKKMLPVGKIADMAQNFGVPMEEVIMGKDDKDSGK